MTERLLTKSRLLVLAVGLLSAWLALAQVEISLAGSVRGPSGDPVQFASVQLEGPGRYVAQTNSEGRFTIANVVPGRYSVRVRKGDYVETFSRDIKTSQLDLVVKW